MLTNLNKALWVPATFLMGLSHIASAAITTGSGDAYGVEVNLTALDGILPITATLATKPTANVDSPDPGSDSGSLLALNESLALGVLGSITAEKAGDNAITVGASSDVTGFLTAGNADAEATVNNLALTLVPAIWPLNDLLEITSTTLGSSSASSGSYGSLDSVGTSTFEGLSIKVLGVEIDLPGTIPANYTLASLQLGVAGLSIVLNEQIETGNGTSSTSLTTNALHVYLNAVSVGEISALTGDVVIASSSSALDAIPEPSAVWILGLAPLLALARRRRIGL